MYMTPTRRVVNDLIALSVLVENNFSEVRPQLVTIFKNWETQYAKYAENIEMYMDKLTELDATRKVWALIPSDIEVLCKAWFRINILINYFSDYGTYIPDAKFVHDDLINAGITYIDIYGSDGTLSEDVTVTTGRFTELVSGEKQYTFSLGKSGTTYSSTYAGKYLYQLNVNGDGNLTNDDYVPGIIASVPTPSHFVPYGTIYKQLTAYPEIYYLAWNVGCTIAKWIKVVDEVTNQAQVDALIEEYGDLYYYDPNKWNFFVNFGDRQEQIITSVYGTTSIRWDLAETYTAGGQYGYKPSSTSDVVAFSSALNPTDQTTFELRQSEYGDLYLRNGYTPLLTFTDSYIYNAYDLVIREILPLVDAFQVTCTDCSTVGLMKIAQTSDPNRIVFMCPNCGNYNPEHMSFPTVYYQGLTHPLFTYDPDFDWYKEYTSTQIIRKQLICKKLWKGRFGSGSKYTMNDLDYLPKVESIGDKEWDKKATTLAKKFLEYIKDFNLDLTLEGMKTLTYKLTEDTTFQVGKAYYTRTGTGTAGDPYVYKKAVVTAGNPVTPANTYYESDSADVYLKLYQLGNVFAIRHELIRVCYAVLKRLLDEGAGIKI